MEKKERTGLIIFIIATLASGWIGVLIDNILTEQPEGNSLGMGCWLILPLLFGIVLRTLGHDWMDFGIKANCKGNIKWYGMAIILFPMITAISLLGALVCGGLKIQSVSLDIVFALMLSSIVGSVIKNIFEEFAWRGYLVPKLMKVPINDWMLYLISGLVWAIWHTAYYMVFLPDEYFESTSRMGMVISGCILMVSWSILFVELYRITKSVWPCVILHTMEDAIPTMLFTSESIFSISEEFEVWLHPISGILATILVIGAGLLLRRKRIHLFK